VTYPKIELHVHFEGTVRPGALFRLARRNGALLHATNAEELGDFNRLRDFDHFIEIWDWGFGSVAHAGEVAGAASVGEALTGFDWSSIELPA
jgi:hypothetical protein